MQLVKLPSGELYLQRGTRKKKEVKDSSFFEFPIYNPFNSYTQFTIGNVVVVCPPELINKKIRLKVEVVEPKKEKMK